jgi:hypothetical protein
MVGGLLGIGKEWLRSGGHCPFMKIIGGNLQKL